MKRLQQLIIFWGPAVVWMIVIFVLSSRQRVEVSTIDIVNFLIFKALHVIEYAILYFLLLRGFGSTPDRHLPPREKRIFAIAIALLYAISDEVHQTFVPTREGRLRDVVIDSMGILIMYIYSKKYYLWKK